MCTGSSVRTELETNGFAIVRNAIDQALVSELQAHISWLLDKYPTIPASKLSHPLSFVDPFWIRAASDPRLVDIAAEVLNSDDVALFVSHYLCKLPGAANPVLWHQDASYFGLEHADGDTTVSPVNMWLAVDQSNSSNGCLRVIPGSHKTGILPITGKTSGEDVLGTSVDVEVDESVAVDIELEPGGCH